MFHHFPSLFFIFHLHRFSSRFIIFHNFFIFFNLDKSRRVPLSLFESTQFPANPPNSPRIHWIPRESAEIQRYRLYRYSFYQWIVFLILPFAKQNIFKRNICLGDFAFNKHSNVNTMNIKSNTLSHTHQKTEHKKYSSKIVKPTNHCAFFWK